MHQQKILGQLTMSRPASTQTPRKADYLDPKRIEGLVPKAEALKTLLRKAAGRGVQLTDALKIFGPEFSRWLHNTRSGCKDPIGYACRLANILRQDSAVIDLPDNQLLKREWQGSLSSARLELAELVDNYVKITLRTHNTLILHRTAKPKINRRYAEIPQEQIAIIVDQMLAKRDNPIFTEPSHAFPNGMIALDTTAILQIIEREGALIPAPEMAHYSRLLPLCTSCGSGVDEYAGHKPVLEAHWDRLSDSIRQATKPDEIIGLASFLSKSVQGRILEGDLKEALLRADKIEDLLKPLQKTHSEQVNRIRSNLREPRIIGLAANGLDEDMIFVKDTEREFGFLSDQHLQEFKCRACRAVMAADPLAQTKIDEARSAFQNAQSRLSDPEGRRKVNREGYGVDFIELTYHIDQIELDDERSAFLVNKIGMIRLHMLLKIFRAPVRKAVVCYWIWLAGNRKEPDWLIKSWAHLQERPTVMQLCLLQVANFRERILSLLSQVVGPQ